MVLYEHFAFDDSTCTNCRKKNSFDPDTSRLSKIIETCSSSNSLGSHELLKPKIVSLIQREKESRIGRELRVSCLLIGYPCENIKWYLNGELLLPTKDGRIYFESKGELVIKKLRKEDYGSVLIHAKNDYGEAYSSISLKADEIRSPKSRERSKTIGNTYVQKDKQLKSRISTLFRKKSHR